MRALEKLMRGRYLRRPLFDIHKIAYQTSKLSSSSLVNSIIRHVNPFNYQRYVVTAGDYPTASYFINRSNYCLGRNVMALNKLSIDKVDLTGKRVLIRYRRVTHFFLPFNYKFNKCQLSK